ncbi:MAG: hypothetical protein JHC81_04830 [Brevundimonas sp.]|uniref:hypothetical protein n=1 Tax=Brevundimonas sp. TaxID=1871086 RepID=UPI001A20371C|nr:hypothetical protein [Brevundimonas sp.]MBJ7446839.1 hypothetical protein [Brevundimonas sp.]
MPLLMKKDFAARHGVGASAVSGWAKRGLLVYAPDPARPGKVLIDAEKSDLLVRGTIDQTRGRPRTAEAAPSSGDAPVAAEAPTTRVQQMSGPEAVRMEEARERIIGRRLENEKNAGRLVAIDVIERQAAERGRMIRERVAAVVRSQQERLAAETDPRVIGSLLITEFDAVFERIADEIEAEARAEADVDAVLSTIPETDGEADEEAEAA